MKAKFKEDQKQMLKESQAQLKEQEKRLQNISDARVASLRKESEIQKQNHQKRLSDMQRSVQNTLDAHQAQIEQLTTELKHKGMRGYQYMRYTAAHNDVNEK